MRFQKGDRIIPKGNVYPLGVLVVQEHSETLTGFPLGGGFVVRVGNVDRYQLVPPDARGVFRLGLFTLDGDDPPVPGYWDGTRWNGWAMPHFPRESVEQICKMLEKVYRTARTEKGYRLIPHDERDDSETAEVLEATAPRPADGLPEETFLFDGWTWSEYEGD